MRLWADHCQGRGKHASGAAGPRGEAPVERPPGRPGPDTGRAGRPVPHGSCFHEPGFRWTQAWEQLSESARGHTLPPLPKQEARSGRLVLPSLPWACCLSSCPSSAAASTPPTTRQGAFNSSLCHHQLDPSLGGWWFHHLHASQWPCLRDTQVFVLRQHLCGWGDHTVRRPHSALGLQLPAG